MATTDGPGGRDTRTLILNAAQGLFAEKGFSATALSEIGKRAQVPKSLVHYHFGPKEQLWIEVKKRRFEDFARAEDEFNAMGPPDRARLRNLADTYFHFLENNLGFVRIFAWMNLEPPHLSQAIQPDKLATLVDRLRQAQTLGLIRDDVRAENVAAVIFSLCISWFTAKNWLTDAGLVDTASRQPNDVYFQDMIKVLLDGLQAT